MKKQINFQDGKTYCLAKQIKVYQLLDNGFTKTKLGNFKYIMPFANNENAPLKEIAQLHIVLNKDLTSFDMFITDPSGMHKINIFKLEQLHSIAALVLYNIRNLEEHQILKAIN